MLYLKIAFTDPPYEFEPNDNSMCCTDDKYCDVDTPGHLWLFWICSNTCVGGGSECEDYELYDDCKEAQNYVTSLHLLITNIRVSKCAKFVILARLLVAVYYYDVDISNPKLERSTKCQLHKYKIWLRKRLVWLTWWNWLKGPVSWVWLAWQACSAGPKCQWYAVDIWCMSRTAMHQPQHASSHLWTWLCLSLLLEHDQRLVRERCQRLASRKVLWKLLHGISMCRTEPTEKNRIPVGK